MTTYLMAGGGTAGHVNPLLAVSDAVRAAEADAKRDSPCAEMRAVFFRCGDEDTASYRQRKIFEAGLQLQDV